MLFIFLKLNNHKGLHQLTSFSHLLQSQFLLPPSLTSRTLTELRSYVAYTSRPFALRTINTLLCLCKNGSVTAPVSHAAPARCCALLRQTSFATPTANATLPGWRSWRRQSSKVGYHESCRKSNQGLCHCYTTPDINMMCE